jgi:nicotinamide-nucleotide amidase
VSSSVDGAREPVCNFIKTGKIVKGGKTTDMDKLDAEVLTIGDELNRGEIVDTNSGFLAERLTGLGAHVRWRTSVTDDAPDIDAAVRHAAGRAQVVVCSGGLGPTEDDRTVEVVSAVLQVPVIQEPHHEERMRARFAERNFTLTPNNLRQVRIPQGSTVLANRKGLAPGFLVKFTGGADLYCLPGVPREMKPMFEEEVAPRIAHRLGSGLKLARRTWRVTGKGESHVDHALAGLMEGVEGATLHFRISYPENLVTVVARRQTQEEADQVIDRLDAEVWRRLGDHVYGIDDETLASAVGKRLLSRHQTLAVAESCTGGMVGQLLTAVPGSSGYFKGGVIAYANDIKHRLLGVPTAILSSEGAVSEATVLEMAEGARAALSADWGVAISGVAGPDGGTPEKPVGTVHIAVIGPDTRETRKLLWPGDREQIRLIGAFSALHLLYKLLHS